MTGRLQPRLDARDRQALGEFFDVVVTALAFVFAALLVVELAADLSPAWQRRVEVAEYAIWAIFAADFLTRLVLAEDRVRYLRTNWLAGVAVVLPAFRVFRLARAVRLARGLRLARVVTTTNRGGRALAKLAGTGGLGFVFGLSVLVVALAGAAVASLEAGHPDAHITSLREGLWWAATTVTTLGSPQYPVSDEARVLGLLVMIYGLAVSGYVTAVLAVLLLGLRERPAPDETAALRDEIAQLREELAAHAEALAARNAGPQPPGRDLTAD
ncbi:MAG: ion transporter [Dehalococcoidia bacterium]|nr:ion transporter [Dehalococcoidia bacterium]